MSRQLMNIFFVMAFIFSGLQGHAQTDETMAALDGLKQRIHHILYTLNSADLTNIKRLQIITSQKTELELELKRILQEEKRGLPTDEIHDVTYDQIDQLMLGITALSVLKLNADQLTVQDESCREAQTLLRVLGASIKSQSGPSYMQVLRKMCVKESTI